MELIQSNTLILQMWEEWLREAKTLARGCPVSHGQSWDQTQVMQLLVQYFLPHTRLLLLTIFNSSANFLKLIET